jgi:uncharacterized protein YcbK (DUF882 family)
MPEMSDTMRLTGAALTRRGFLALGACLAATAFAPGVAAAARRSRPEVRELSFSNIHTGESLTTVYWERGEYVPGALMDIDSILRDHYTDEIHAISPQLIDLLFVLRRRLGTARPYTVVSGYRSPATNEYLRSLDPTRVAEHSLHLTGEAIDIRVPDRPLRRVRDAALALHGGGVGFYPRSGFVHVDVGPPRHW